MNEFNAMSDLVADAEELLSKLGRSASSDIRELSSRVESSIGEMKGVFRDRLKKGENTLRGVTKTGVGFAKQNPSMSMAVGLCVAFTVIYMMFSRNDD